MSNSAKASARNSPTTIGERFDDAAALRTEISRLSDHVGAIRIETAAAKAQLEALKRACAAKFAQRTASVGRPSS